MLQKDGASDGVAACTQATHTSELACVPDMQANGPIFQ